MTKKGALVIVSGPSGSGKSTLISKLQAIRPTTLHVSISATTRPPRPGERDGVHYHFWTPVRFEKEIEAGAFLEWACVHGHRYGTLRGEVDPFREQGQTVVLDIDVQGAAQIRSRYPDSVSIFIRAPSSEVYEQRLRARGSEDESAIRRRLEGARRELAHAGEYDYEVINADVDSAFAEFTAIIDRVA
jgi:guanylate kinase